MAKHRRGSFNSMARQSAIIAATSSLLWCLVRDVAMYDTIFRVALVYFVITIVGYGVAALLARLAAEPPLVHVPDEAAPILKQIEGKS